MRLSGGKLHDEYRQHSEHHHHLIYEHCGAYLPIADADLATLKVALYGGCGFRLDMDHLARRRYCATCAAGDTAAEVRAS